MNNIMGLIVSMLLLFSLPLQANVVGIDAQNFNPTTNGLDFVTVQSSETLEPGIINLGLFFNYAINTLPNYENKTTQTRLEPRDQLTSMDMNIGLGLTKNWDMGLSIPQVVSQNVDDSTNVFRGQFGKTGVTEYRLNTKYRFFGDSRGGLATILSMNWFVLENYPFTGTNPGPTFNAELAYDFTLGDFNLGANIGYRFRNPGDPIAGIPVQPYPDEFIFSFAASYLVTSLNTKLIAEIYSSIPTKQVQFTSDRELSSAEFLLGAKWDITRSIAFHAGATTELYQGAASPDWRVYTGLNWNFGPLYGKQYQTEPQVAFIEDINFAEPVATSETFIAKDVLFEFNSSRVTPDFRATLQKLAQYLKKGQGFQSLVITGHTDSIGSRAYNDNLSLKRARSVRKTLLTFLPANDHNKVQALGRGEREPIADNGNYQGRALNRRVEFNLIRGS